MRARAPAKAILSGEHAVVYGQPALALALARYAKVSISSPDPALTGRCELRLDQLGLCAVLELERLPAFAAQCQQRHQWFGEGKLAIDAVLTDAADLYRYALALLLDLQPELNGALSGRRIGLNSDIPIGSGMGSSAATVAALLRAVSALSTQPLSSEDLGQLTTRCEMLQHGRSSGLDPAVCARGGLVRFEQGALQALPVELDAHWYLVDSGQPACSTGSCTSWVRQRFADSPVWSEFGAVTDQLGAALVRANPGAIIAALRLNHRLLCRIGVVPEPVQRFIETVEQQGGAAKVSGAGAVSGDQAGLLLVYYPGDPARLFQSAGYSWQPMEPDYHGAQLQD